MKVLVTGGCGFVGSHIVDRLVTDSHEVVSLDAHVGECGLKLAGISVSQCRHFAGSIQDLSKDFDDLEGFDAVVHAAAYAELRHNWDSRAERDVLMLQNVVATQLLLEAAPPSVPVIYLSSASVYGSAPDATRGLYERQSYEGDANASTIESPYAATKMAGELLVAAYAFKRQSPWYALRLVNVVGSRMHRGVIVDFVRMMREKGAIHAADDGKQRKNWVHVADVAELVAKIVKGSGPNHGELAGGVYNVASGERISWWDIVDAMGVPRDKVTYEDRDRGAVGDPHNLNVSGAKLAPYYLCTRPVRDGIADALTSLGWPS